MAVDSHQHYWTLERGDYGWLQADSPLYRNYQPPELAALCADTDVACTVVVQAAPTTDETDYLLSLADAHPSIAKVVGWVDFDDPVGAIRHLSGWARHGKFAGVRPMLEDIPDPAWVALPKHRRVFEALANLDSSFDALVRPQHLPHLDLVLSRMPELRCVIDHGAKPDIESGAWQPWADDISRLAGRHQRLHCKLSGLITEVHPEHGYEQLAPYMDHLLDSFGPGRLMWGSDWPVLDLVSDYRQWFEFARSWAVNKGAEVVHAIFEQTATAFYRIPEHFVR